MKFNKQLVFLCHQIFYWPLGKLLTRSVNSVNVVVEESPWKRKFQTPY